MPNSEYSFDNTFFTANRKRLLGLIDGVIVIPGAGLLQKSTDTTYPFRQASSFWYFSGCNEPNATLIISKDESFIIIPKPHRSYEAFEGTIDIGKIIQDSGLNDVYYEREGYQRLGTLLKGKKELYTLPKQPNYYAHIGMFTNPFRNKVLQKLKRSFPEIEQKSCASEIAILRMKKSVQEIEASRRAFAITTEVFLSLEELLKRQKFTNEKQLENFFTTEFLKRNVSHAYEPIVASGKNSTVLHYQLNNAPLENNGLILLDIGAEYAGYNADITRVYATSEPSQLQKDTYNAVVSWQKEGINYLKNNPTRRDYERFMREKGKKYLSELGVSFASSEEEFRYMPHAAGHFIGLDVHDVGLDEVAMEDGVIYMVEPGLYFPDEGFGIRLEDPVLIKEGSCEVLTTNLKHNFVL